MVVWLTPNVLTTNDGFALRLEQARERTATARLVISGPVNALRAQGRGRIQLRRG